MGPALSHLLAGGIIRGPGHGDDGPGGLLLRLGHRRRGADRRHGDGHLEGGVLDGHGDDAVRRHGGVDVLQPVARVLKRRRLIQALRPEPEADAVFALDEGGERQVAVVAHGQCHATLQHTGLAARVGHLAHREDVLAGSEGDLGGLLRRDGGGDLAALHHGDGRGVAVLDGDGPGTGEQHLGRREAIALEDQRPRRRALHSEVLALDDDLQVGHRPHHAALHPTERAADERRCTERLDGAGVEGALGGRQQGRLDDDATAHAGLLVGGRVLGPRATGEEDGRDETRDDTDAAHGAHCSSHPGGGRQVPTVGVPR
jgi:hypothetical protein